MDQITIVKHIREGHDLLSLPQTLSEILKEAENPNFTAEALAKIILRDPTMTGRILKVANSSFYSRSSNIKTVQQAVQLLGITTVKCLVLSTSVFRPEKISKETGVDVKLLFSSFLTAAVGAERIARATGLKQTEEAFVAGLLHEIGVIYLLEYYPGEYRNILQHKVKATRMLEAEKEVFGIDHAEVGFHLASRWRLPDYVCNAVRSHHQFVSIDDCDKMTRCVLLASLLAPESWSTYTEDLEERLSILAKVATSLELSQCQVDEISISMLASAVEIASHMEVDIGSTEELLTRANREIWRSYSTIEKLFKEREELMTRLLSEERQKGALESKNIAIATLSHYLNNAAMAVYGRSQILRMTAERGDVGLLADKLPDSLDVIDRSIRKIVAVLAEIKAISPIEEVKFINTSQAMDLDERVVRRLKAMEKDSGLILPDEVEESIGEPR